MLRLLLLLILAALPAGASDPLSRAIGGAFSLIDHHGQPRTERDPEGHHQLLFFGYANCPDICTAALPLMAMVVDELAKAGHPLRPVMITVDPLVDTPETMGAPMTQIHPKFIGLSGSDEALAASYEAFNVDVEPLFTGPDGQTIYAHGSFIYLLNPEGQFLTLIPPILGPDEVAMIVKRYLPS